MKKYLIGMAAALLTAGSANASFIMYLDDKSTTGIDVVVQDETVAGILTGIGLTTDPDGRPGDIGTLEYSGSLNNFFLSSSIALSQGTLEAPGSIFDLFSLNVSGGSGELEIGVTDTGFEGDESFVFGIGGTTDGSVSAAAYLDEGNAEFGQGTEIGSVTGLTGLAFDYQSGATVLTGVTNPYSLTVITTLDHSGGRVNVTSFDAAISVPEPSIIALFGLGLAGLGFAGRRRKAK